VRALVLIQWSDSLARWRWGLRGSLTPVECTTWAIALQVLGGLAELGGVILAMLEIRDRARKLRKYERALMQVGTTRRARWDVHEPKEAPQREQDPTLEERLQALQNRVEQIPAEIVRARELAISEAVSQANARSGEIGSELRQEVRKLATLLVGTVSGHKRAYVSAFSLVIGLVVQSAGSILGNLCQ
jgi:hypothetical protein